MKDKFLTTSGAAQALHDMGVHVAEQTIRSLERRKELVAVRDSAGRRLFKFADLERFARRRQEKNTATAL
jgi:DNA-binding transcriptional MerR regulator